MNRRSFTASILSLLTLPLMPFRASAALSQKSRLTFADMKDGQHSLEEVAQVFDDCRAILREAYNDEHRNYHLYKSDKWAAKAFADNPWPLPASYAAHKALQVFWPKMKSSTAKEWYTPTRWHGQVDVVQVENFDPYDRLPEWAVLECAAMRTHMKLQFEADGLPICVSIERGPDMEAEANSFGRPFGPVTKWHPMSSDMGRYDFSEEELIPLRRLPVTYARVQRLIALGR